MLHPQAGVSWLGLHTCTQLRTAYTHGYGRFVTAFARLPCHMSSLLPCKVTCSWVTLDLLADGIVAVIIHSARVCTLGMCVCVLLSA